ncbi:DUF3800 domain-containing protein [Thermococcus sp. GR6]|uniref:DUF3800 domain-containing protein n=1 Tax=Thermococcus sp. GR6 TaxID=1638256 RepID=UPI0014320D37|nr:DUF3800 domain-containing protein [Thermococcus sp. GR6]NJE42040.1 hypothetical protein [Thermococcus sp. GR6]
MVRSISLNIYADEQMGLKYDDHEFLAIGILLIPEAKHDKIINDLLNLRCLNEKNTHGWYWNYEDCPAKDICKPMYHKYNNVEIHYKKIKNHDSRFKIAKRWLRYVKSETIPFSILYINLTNLSAERFGQELWHQNVYNRFFRTNLKFALRTFFFNGSYDKIVVNAIFHDMSEGLKKHSYFEIKNPKKVEKELNGNLLGGKHVIMPDKVTFIESDHKKSDSKKESQLVQLTDLLLGVVTQNIFYTARNNNAKKELAMIIRPVIVDFFENPYRGFYYKRNISFFPKYPIQDAEFMFQDLEGSIRIETRKNLFYRDISLKMPSVREKGQLSLESWFDKA